MDLTKKSEHAASGATIVRDDESLDMEDSVRRRNIATRVAIAVLLLSLLAFGTGFFVLDGTALGFVLAFGGALLAYEAYLLYAKARGSKQTADK